MLKRRTLLVAAAAWPLLSLAQNAVPSEGWRWYDVRDLTIEGKGWTNTADFYDRYPAKAEPIVRAPVWALSRDSAGLCARFLTDSPRLSARWVVRKDALALPHMPATGVSGLDLYLKDHGRWHWAGQGRPLKYPTNQCALATGLRPAKREFLLYLPLYNGVTSVEIGLAPDASIEAAPVRPQKPLVFYGTSILQGGCASRPGMAYPAIIGRHLDCPAINLGFSGNGRSEPEVARLLAELDPAIYVLDPLPNMDAAGVTERIEPFVKTLRQAHPQTPIVLVENEIYADAPFAEARTKNCAEKNAALAAAYRRLIKAGEKKLYYISAKGLLGDDGEATVDGVHATDLGFTRIAAKIEPVLRKLLKM